MIVPVILSGGSGTRLWPLSRKLYPKQFLSLANKTTLFQDTILRLPSKASNPIIICNEEHRFIAAEQLRQIDTKNKGIILEPIGRNTAPAITLAAISLLQNGEDPLLLVLSADHLIKDISGFHKSIEIASVIANKNKLVSLGVHPTRPETGYGYIEIEQNNKNDHYKIISFNEKPGIEKAEKYINSKNFFWNTGIFMFKASTFIRELKKYEPEIYNLCEKSLNKTSKDNDFIRIDSSAFLKCPNKSIDYAIMEKTNEAFVVPFDGYWSDIGSWEALWESKAKDKNRNIIEGDVILRQVKNSFIHGTNRLVTVNNLENIIVVDTQDALLVSSIDNSQEIKNIVEVLKNKKRNESENHRKVYRPWGYFDSIDSGKGFQVKRISVNPGAKLSLQKHKKRAEHWIIVKGVAIITCGKKVFQLDENQSTYIPKGEVHRLENREESPLEIIEIQTGSYLGEDDIIRLEDDYKRE
jgi:mannose-1-phosphate guanylyltransferase